MYKFNYGDVVRLNEREFSPYLFPQHTRGFSHFPEYIKYESLFHMYGKITHDNITLEENGYEILNHDWLTWWKSNQYCIDYSINFCLVDFDGKLFIFPEQVLLKMPSSHLYLSYIDKETRERLKIYENIIPKKYEQINILTKDGVALYGLIKYLMAIIEEIEKFPPTMQLEWEIEKLKSEKEDLQNEIDFMKKTIKTIKTEWNKL